MSRVGSDRSPASVTHSLFAFLDARGIPYAALGDPRGLREDPTSDVDIVVEEAWTPSLPRLVREFCRDHRLQLVQMLQHEQTAWYFVVAWRDEAGRLRFLAPDFCGDYYRNGRLYLRADELLPRRARFTDHHPAAGPYVPSPDMAFLYYLIKKIDKGQLLEEHARYLSWCWAEDPRGAQRQVERFWSGDHVAWIAEAAATGDWTTAVSRLKTLRSALRRGQQVAPRHALGEARRIIQRLTRPTGLWVAFLGPDGSGKTTVLRHVTESLAPAFRRTKQYHLRPHLGGDGTPTGSGPPPTRGEPRSPLGSIVKLGYWWLDYTVGFVIDVLPRLIGSTLVLFDRYFPDLYIDPERYRFRGPRWFADLVDRTIPHPDVFIVLDVPGQLVTERKGELPPEEADAQMSAYRRLAKRPGYHLVNAAASIDDSVAGTEKVVLDHMESRTARRLGLP